MYARSSTLALPDGYNFPHHPYTIQQQLMQSLYMILENKHIGIFESPTGTGKSLTLSCAALRWLEDHEALVQKDLRDNIAACEKEIKELQQEHDWITAQHAARLKSEKLKQLKNVQNQLMEREQQLLEMKERQKSLQQERKIWQKKDLNAGIKLVSSAKIGKEVDIDNELSDQSDEDEDVRDEKEQSADEAGYRDVQIFFCSRTHSQLAQVVEEVKRTVYGSRIRCVSLASRQQLCIHPEVKKLGNVMHMNERCLEMARKGGKCEVSGAKKSRSSLRSIQKCVYKAPQAVKQLSEAALVDVLDIEDLIIEGKAIEACPYYAARGAVDIAQLVMLPYQTLLHRRTRLQSGIQLRGAIVIIDEAHNLLDTIAQLHSCELTLGQLRSAHQQIDGYKKRYGKVMRSQNLLHINQLLFIVKQLIKFLVPVDGETAIESMPSRVLQTYQLMSEGEFYNMDLVQLLKFCEQKKLAQKLQGFAHHLAANPQILSTKAQTPKPKTTTATILQRLAKEHQQQHEKQIKFKQSNVENEFLTTVEVTKATNQQSHQSSSIRPVLAFLEALTEAAEDGRILVNINAAGDATRCTLKYVLLNPGSHFQDIVREARSIILAGGTMSPTRDLKEQLFHSCIERVELHSYNHVVPSDAVAPFIVSQGPTGQRLCFNWTERNDMHMINELGNLLQDLCNIIPSGIVCFFPSYDYLDKVYTHLQQSDMIAVLSHKKCIFRETRTTCTDDLLDKYAKAIKKSNGALLFSVVGGKLSEGLNFADELGRGVIVVGLPYPNKQSLELQERMKYLDAQFGPQSGNEYYENLCMKAVNQCIGRSVRHIRDYAAVFLIDSRYNNERIKCKLPLWILKRLTAPREFKTIYEATKEFFSKHA